MDVIEEQVDTENIDSKSLNVQDPKYIHPDSDIRTRHQINSKGELKEMYPECFFRHRYIQKLQVPHRTGPQGQTSHSPAKKDSFIIAAKVGERTR